jgi:hypothetical protein
MAVVNRLEARAAVLADLQANLTDLQAIYDYLPKDLQGQSPVCTIESGPIAQTHTPDEPQAVNLVVGFWVRRDGEAGSGMTAEDAADLIDTLAAGLATRMFAAFNATFPRESEIGYETIDGNDYQIELHYVQMQWW